MKKFIEFLIQKQWFRLHYSPAKMFTIIGVVNIVKKACETQRKACARIYLSHYDGEHYDERCHQSIESAEIKEEDYGSI